MALLAVSVLVLNAIDMMYFHIRGDHFTITIDSFVVKIPNKFIQF